MLDWLKSNNGYNIPTNEAPKYTDWLSKTDIVTGKQIGRAHV